MKEDDDDYFGGRNNAEAASSVLKDSGYSDVAANSPEDTNRLLSRREGNKSRDTFKNTKIKSVSSLSAQSRYLSTRSSSNNHPDTSSITEHEERLDEFPSIVIEEKRTRGSKHSSSARERATVGPAGRLVKRRQSFRCLNRYPRAAPSFSSP